LKKGRGFSNHSKKKESRPGRFSPAEGEEAKTDDRVFDPKEGTLSRDVVNNLKKGPRRKPKKKSNNTVRKKIRGFRKGGKKGQFAVGGEEFRKGVRHPSSPKKGYLRALERDLGREKKKNSHENL